MHGAPLLHGVEIYHGRPIFYDLGNFIYNVPPTLTYIGEPMAWESVLAYVQFQGKKLQSFSFRPIILNFMCVIHPDILNADTNNECLDLRPLLSPLSTLISIYIFQL